MQARTCTGCSRVYRLKPSDRLAAGWLSIRLGEIDHERAGLFCPRCTEGMMRSCLPVASIQLEAVGEGLADGTADR